MTLTIPHPPQAQPPAGVLFTLYTCPANTRVVFGMLKMCNNSAVATVVRVTLAVNGAADDPAGSQNLHNNTPLAGYQSFTVIEPWELAPGDQIRVQSGNGLVAFTGSVLQRS